MRGMWIAALFVSAVAVDDMFDESAGLSLLQLRANASKVSHTHYWKAGGCRANLPATKDCGWDSDMHMRGRFSGEQNPDFHEQGLRAGAYTTDGSVTMQVFQCPWNGNGGISSTSGVAVQMGSDVMEFLRPADCQEYVYMKLNGAVFDMNQLPYEGDDGLYIERVRHNEICVDAPDGRSSFAIKYKMNQRGSCHNRDNQAWYDIDLKIAEDVTVVGDDSACGMTYQGSPVVGVRQITGEPGTEQSLFSSESHDHLCQYCNWGGRNCDKPPPPPPMPPSEQMCADNGCSYDTARSLCDSLRTNEEVFEGCVMDICASCGDDVDPVAIAQAAIESEGIFVPGPACVDAGESCGLPTETCSSSVKMNTHTVSQNNLAGAGPDEGDEIIRFTNAAAVNGQIIDVILRVVGGIYQGKSERNGKKGLFGQINLRNDKSVDLELSLVDSASGNPVTVDSLALSFYDLDEGKRGKSRTTVTSCDATNAILTTNSELSLLRPNGCYAVSSSQPGGASNNPESPLSLTPTQAGRSVTFSYESVSKVTFTLAISKGFGYRNTFFSIEPTLACLDGFDPAMELTLPEPGVEDALR